MLHTVTGGYSLQDTNGDFYGTTNFGGASGVTFDGVHARSENPQRSVR
jgi:hypothetical protein